MMSLCYLYEPFPKIQKKDEKEYREFCLSKVAINDIQLLNKGDVIHLHHRLGVLIVSLKKKKKTLLLSLSI